MVQPLLNVDRIAGWREQEPRQALAQARLAQGEMELAQRLFAAYVDGLRSQDAMSRNQMRLSALEDQLRAVMARFAADGCWNFDPHTWVLEDGGMKQVDEAQLAFKQLADPLGLMNPGKVRAWDERVLGIPGGGL